MTVGVEVRRQAGCDAVRLTGLKRGTTDKEACRDVRSRFAMFAMLAALHRQLGSCVQHTTPPCMLQYSVQLGSSMGQCIDACMACSLHTRSTVRGAGPAPYTAWNIADQSTHVSSSAQRSSPPSPKYNCPAFKLLLGRCANLTHLCPPTSYIQPPTPCTRPPTGSYPPPTATQRAKQG